MQSADEFATAIGEQARAERERQGLRQDEVALAAGVSPRAVFQVEHGKPTSRLDVVARILAALGLSLHVAPAARTLARAGEPRSWFEIYQDASGAFRWRLRMPNNRIVANSSDGYASRTGALHAVTEMTRAAQASQIADAT